MTKRDARKIALDSIISHLDVSLDSEGDLQYGWPDDDDDRAKVETAARDIIDSLITQRNRLT